MELEGQTSIDDLLEAVSFITITADADAETESGPAFTTHQLNRHVGSPEDLGIAGSAIEAAAEVHRRVES